MAAKTAKSRTFSFSSELGAARTVQSEIEAALLAASFGEKEIFAIKLALEEGLVNAVKHGNRLDPKKHVHVEYTVNTEKFEIRIRDEGPGFDPGCIPDPTAPENLERPCGRGLLLMRHYMNHVEYSDNGRALHMFKLRNGKH